MTAQLITMYVPIFREKLAKLEGRGHGNTEEAKRLRAAIAVVEQVRNTDPATEKYLSAAA